MGEQIHVRSACEPCHERKIRCITGSEGGPCHGCRSRKLKCYFLPRQKSGRPPHKQNRSASSTQYSARLAHSEYPIPMTLVDDAGAGAGAGAVDGSLAWTWNDSPTSRHSSYQSEYLASNETGTSMSVTNFPISASTQSPLLPYPSTQMTTGEGQSLHDNEDRPSTTTTAISKATSWSSRSRSPLERETGESKFAGLLQHCTMIQTHIATLHSLPLYASDASALTSAEASNLELSSLIEDIEAACNHIFGIYGVSGPVKTPGAAAGGAEALMSLATAVIIKVTQLYELVLDHDLVKNHKLDMLQCKRLDLCNIQLQIIIARIQQLKKEGTSVETCLAMTASIIEEKLKWVNS